MLCLKISEPDLYFMRTFEGERGRTQYTVQNANGSTGFSDLDLKKGNKIYLVSYDFNAVRYIGKTITTVKVRLNESLCTPKYRWAKIHTEYKLLTWDLSNLMTRKDKALEAVEAELTLIFRIFQRGWPTHQNSIAFRWVNETRLAHDARYIASEMFKQYFDLAVKSGELSDPDFFQKERDRTLDTLKIISP